MYSSFAVRPLYEATEQYHVKESSEVYTKDQLLAVLQQMCPAALAKFPPPGAFEVREHHLGQYALKVGYTMTKKSRKVGDLLWLDERQQPSVSSYDEFSYTQRAYDRTVRENKIRRSEIGLYYTTNEDAYRNKYIKNAKIIKDDNVFGKLTNHGTTSPFSLTMKALLRLVLLYCDRATEYRILENKGGNKTGLEPLVRALRKVAKRTATAEEEGIGAALEEINAGAAATEEEGDPSAMEDGTRALVSLEDKKRKGAVDDELVERTLTKKSRAC
jgi:hypothetical protein